MSRTRTETTVWRRIRTDRTQLRLVAVVAVVALAAVVVGWAPVVPAGGSAPAIVVYGDSLIVEAKADLEARLATLVPDWDVMVDAYGGTAQCDWHEMMERDAATMDVRVVVIAFSGNFLTPCITSRDRVTGYTDDANWAVDLWVDRIGAQLLFVAAPGHVGTYPADNEIARAYRRVAQARRVSMVETDALFIDHASFTYTSTALPLTDEGTADVAIRSPDECHFCPNGYDIGAECTEYSSGAVRYAEAITERVAQAIGRPETERHELIRSRNEENHRQRHRTEPDQGGID
jgi:hypothetical protein